MSSAPRDSGGRFRNLDGSGAHPPGVVFRWAVLDRLAGRRRRSPARAEVPVVSPDRALLATPASRPRITWLGHASFLVQLDGASLLIDPVFSDRIGGLIRRNVPAPLSAAELPRIDATLVTHNHYDHVDAPSVRGAHPPALAGLGMSRLPPCKELDWWQAARLTGRGRPGSGPSQHWPRRGRAHTH